MAEEDIIYGKNRHFFGGIEPSNMRKFKVAYKNGANEITAELPTDTVVNGQTLCTVAGAVICRSTERYPVDEFDGEIIANITRSTTIRDTAVETGIGYYYAAFPYTTQGVYARSAVNRATINIPDPVISFIAQSQYDFDTETPSIKLTVKLPESASGAVIRKSQNGFPVSETDGDECVTMTESGTYIDTDVVLYDTYYYSVFTYLENGLFNRDLSHGVSIVSRTYNYLFGYDLELDNEDPLTRVTYPEGLDNSKYSPAFMDYENDSFNYGDWPDTAGTYFMPKPCMLTWGGTVDHYLDQNDYTKKDDGAHTSSVDNPAFEGNAMMEWPKIYTHREVVDGVYKFRCSDIPQGDGWKCWCNYGVAYVNKNYYLDTEVDNFYTSIYTGARYNDTGYLRSISGLAPYKGETFTTTRGKAICDSKYSTITGYSYLSWDIDLLADHMLINDLLVMMAKTTDCQTAYGNGVGNSKSRINNGTLNDKGLFWGSNEWDKGVKVFGIENFWGNYSHFVAGFMCKSATAYVQALKINTSDIYQASASTLRADFGETSRALSIRPSFTGTNGGYISEMQYIAFGLLPCGASGASNKYECDTMKWSTGSSVTYFSIGGINANTFQNGPFHLQNVASNEVPSDTGAFLSYRAMKEETR